MRKSRTFWLPAALVLLGAYLCTGVFADPLSPTQLTITILHDNDLHGHLLSYNYTEVGRSPQEQPERGGAARRATLVRQLHHSIHNPVLLIDSGDLATRGPLVTTYQGIADVEAMNDIGYDLMAIGNNEFKLKDGADATDAAGAQGDLLQVIKRSRFPWVCANATDNRGAFLEGVEPYVVRDIDGVRIGFLGLTAPRSASYPQTKGWTISDPIAAAKEWIPEARKHCDILIAVTHIGTDQDKELAAQTTGLDAIVGGDSHTFLYKPVVVANPAGYQVPIVQDGEFGADLGRFDLNLARDGSGQWKIASYNDVLMTVGPKIPEAKDVDETLAPYLLPFQTVVGHIGAIGTDPKARLSQTVQILVDAMHQQTGADIAINPGGADNGLFEVFRHSAVTRYDVFCILPFHDDVAVANLTGDQIKAILASAPGTVTAGDVAHLDSAKTYRVAAVDYAAASVYHITATPPAGIDPDIRSIVIGYLQGSGAAEVK